MKSAQTPCLSETTELLYTLQEAAALLQVPVADLEHAIAAKSLLFEHQYGRKLISARDLDAYRVQHRIVSPSVPDAASERKHEQ